MFCLGMESKLDVEENEDMAWASRSLGLRSRVFVEQHEQKHRSRNKYTYVKKSKELNCLMWQTGNRKFVRLKLAMEHRFNCHLDTL